jgi:spore maturation protein CgeB
MITPRHAEMLASSPTLPPLQGVMLGLSLTSSWGNAHASIYRGLAREMNARGHRILFLERDQPWYAQNRDLPRPPYARVELYRSVDELQSRFADALAQADFVMVGSFVPDGVAVGEWVARTAKGLKVFYDIDTPVTLAGLERDEGPYLAPALVPRYDLYLSITGGPTLELIRRRYGARHVGALYCAGDAELYYPQPAESRWDLGYLGAPGQERPALLDSLLLQPARLRPHSRFVVAGPPAPADADWPANVERCGTPAPGTHRAFYNRQRFVLNITRSEVAGPGYSPSARLFEAAACGTPIISDYWAGLESFFVPGEEMLVARSSADVLRFLACTSDDRRRAIGRRARARVLAEHTAAHRAVQFEGHRLGCRAARAARRRRARIQRGNVMAARDRA